MFFFKFALLIYNFNNFSNVSSVYAQHAQPGFLKDENVYPLFYSSLTKQIHRVFPLYFPNKVFIIIRFIFGYFYFLTIRDELPDSKK